MSMNYFAFFPALANKATNPNAEVTGYFANPAGPSGEQHAALGGQGISIVSYSKKQEEAMKFLEWFIRTTSRRSGPNSAATPATPRCWSPTEFRKATPYNEAFYQTMFMVKDFWAVPEYAELLTQINNRIYPFIVGGEGTAKEALDGLAAGLDRDVQEVRPSIASGQRRRPEGRHRLLRPSAMMRRIGRQALAVMAKLTSRIRARRRAAGAISPSAISSSSRRSSS